MRKMFAIVCVIGFWIFIGCECETGESSSRQWPPDVKNEIVSGLQYVKDPRTNLCFAYYLGVVQGGLVLTTVPCDAIPPELLTVAK